MENDNAGSDDERESSMEERPESSPEPSLVLERMLEWFRGFHLDREKSKAADWAMVVVTALGAVLVALQIRDTRASFKVDERARVELESVNKVKRTFQLVGGPIITDETYELYPKNVGKTLARKVVMKAVAFPAVVKLMEASDIECIEGLLKPDARVVEILNRSAGLCRDVASRQVSDFGSAVIPPVLAPEEKSITPYVLRSSGKGNTPVAVAGSDVIVGRIDYLDEFGGNHWKTFCVYDTHEVVNRVISDKFLSCTHGNSEDEDPD